RMVLNVEPNVTKNFSTDPTTDASTMKAWRYAYDDAGELVGTSDARGCGSNYHYDAAGRLVAEDYSPCLAHHPDYSTPDFTFGAEAGIEVLNRYDSPPETTDVTGITTAEPSCAIATGLYAGRLVSVSDRGQRTITTYDGRGRVPCVARQMAKPGVPSDVVAARYTPTWYVQTAKFDGADRPVEEGTGVYSLRTKVPQLLGGDGKSNVTTSYTKRGSVLAVGSSYGALVNGVTHDADGLALSIGYGDVAKTTTEYTYDDKRRLRTRADVPRTTTGLVGVHDHPDPHVWEWRSDDVPAAARGLGLHVRRR
ncbi:MAG: hypothetical protein IPJ34_36440, partial [Myxococcales bacterium]|nr:hypothetical protein [Myxococcales bacterium]